MKRILVAMALVLMSAGTAMAHGGVSFSVGIGVPIAPYYNGYPAYTYPVPYGYYYGAPYGYYYPTPPVVYGYDPFYGPVYGHRGFGHRHFMRGGGRFHGNHFGHGHGRWHGR